MRILHIFTHIYACFAAFAASPAPTHPSIRGAALRAAPTKGGGPPKAAPPFVGSLKDGCVGAGDAANAAKHA